MKGLLFASLVAFLAYYVYKISFQRTIVIRREDLLPFYDYVIVGAGTAGSILAARLSELPNVTILVLEAGHDDLDHPYTQWLSLEQHLQLTDFDWKYMTVPQTHCCDGLIDKQSRWPRGKGLGGCSSHHGAVHVRGSRYDYDLWDKELGPDSGWSFDEVFAYFKKMENVKNIAGLDKNLHGYDGPAVLTDTGFTPLAETLLEATKNLGYPFRTDMNAMGGKDDQEGFSSFHRALDRGRRVTMAEAYLRPALKENAHRLHVLTNAHVTKILIDDSDQELLPVATGVEFVHEGATHQINAYREVIISAGAIGTPQLLMLSGIGPKAELEKHNIRIVTDMPAVGQNLYDHPWVPLGATINDSQVSYNPAVPENFIDFTIAKLQYHLFRAGPLANSGLEFCGFVRSRITDEPWPDLQIYLIGSAIPAPYNVFNFNDKALNTIHGSTPEKAGRKRVVVLPILLHPHNAGEIRLKSADPFDQPIIDPKYLQNQYDVDILVKGLNISLQLIRSPEARKYDMQLSGEHAPACEHLQLWTEEYLKCYVRSMLLTVYHPVGTCRMGKSSNNSVVDTRLRVHGIDHLRIVDASIFPFQVSANTNAPTMMVAEKASDLIKHDYHHPETPTVSQPATSLPQGPPKTATAAPSQKPEVEPEPEVVEEDEDEEGCYDPEDEEEEEEETKAPTPP